MLISLRHHLVIFAMPKCASTAIEAAISDQMDMVLTNNPGIKHTTFRKFDRYLRPYLETYSKEPFETVCLFREPLDWFHSWWRYRQRPEVPDPSRSTRGISFDEFVNAALDDQPGPAKIGRQARFVSGRDGRVGIDRIFRYENLGACLAYLGQRTNIDISLDRLNVSPPGQGSEILDPETRRRAGSALSEDYRIYRAVAQ